MIIDINKIKFTNRFDFKIFLNEQEEYKASMSFPKFLGVRSLFKPQTSIININLFKCSDNSKKIMITKQLSWFKKRYTLFEEGGHHSEFISKSFWKNHFQYVSGNNLFEIFSHRSLDSKYSIYKNNVQVAWWKKQSVTWFGGDNYKILADDNCDLELIIAFCLIIDEGLRDISASSHQQGEIVLKLGNITPEKRKFNENWKPRLG